MAGGGFVEEMMREQQMSLLEATCGDLFDHIDDLLDFPKEDSAADVLLLDAPAPGSPLSARIIDVGGARSNAPPALEQPPLMAAMPPPSPQDAFFAAVGAPVFDAKDVGGHIGTVGPPHCTPFLHVSASSLALPSTISASRRAPLGPAAGPAPPPVTTARIAVVGRATHAFNFFFIFSFRKK